MRESNHRDFVVGAAILLLALVLRVVGLRFGLPMAEARPDEITIAFQAMKFGTGDLNPHSFNYPSFFKYVVFVLFGAEFAIGRALGVFVGKEDFLRTFFSGAVEFRFLMRVWSAVAGTACVALLLAGPGRRFSALLLAVCFLHVRDSHFGVTDTTMVTLATASVLASVELRRTGSARVAMWAGVLAGLATSTKYNAALLAVPLVIAAFSSGGRTLDLLTAGGAAMVLSFLVGSPWALLDFATFQKDFLYEVRHLAAGQFVDVGDPWAYHLGTTLRLGVGLPLLVGGLLGWLLLARHDRRTAAVLVSFPVVYYFAIGRGESAFFRYMLPVVPFLCVGAGMLAEWLPRRAGIPLLLGMAAPTFAASVQSDALMRAGDTRDAMGAWIEANVPTDAEIVHAGAYTGAPMLQRNVVNQTREYMARQGRADASGFRKPDDLKWYDPARPAYDVVFVRKAGIDFASQRDVAALLADPPEWLMLEDYFLEHYSAVPSELRALAAAGYDVARREEAFAPGSVGRFDQQDALYLPVADFDGFTRMGPTLTLYHRRAP